MTYKRAAIWLPGTTFEQGACIAADEDEGEARMVEDEIKGEKRIEGVHDDGMVFVASGAVE